MRNKFWDTRSDSYNYNGLRSKKKLVEPPRCPWCAGTFDRPWATDATSHRNIQRAVKKGEMRLRQISHGFGSRSRTTAICNHECHKGEENGK